VNGWHGSYENPTATDVACLIDLWPRTTVFWWLLQELLLHRAWLCSGQPDKQGHCATVRHQHHQQQRHSLGVGTGHMCQPIWQRHRPGLLWWCLSQQLSCGTHNYWTCTV
jgi:hypothetical protein